VTAADVPSRRWRLGSSAGLESLNFGRAPCVCMLTRDVFAFPTPGRLLWGRARQRRWAAGLPIVTTRVAAIPEAVRRRRERQRLSSSRSTTPRALRERLERLAKSPDLRKRMGAVLRGALGEESFDMDKERKPELAEVLGGSQSRWFPPRKRVTGIDDRGDVHQVPGARAGRVSSPVRTGLTHRRHFVIRVHLRSQHASQPSQPTAGLRLRPAGHLGPAGSA